ncbi:MAG: FHA domain-containing protein [Aphanothece sp. CMT-3BRIN-NPC111]|jgi:pSer/pThr/pTyr-binding forkhead associated (FHA) protein|nr:FHA domain-containing protein [Aphanothece sp. CMT-3BRIN-NPC111]
MSSKSEKLAQRIQDIQKFVAARVNREPKFGAVAEELSKLADALKPRKLTVQIVSLYPMLAQALQNLVNTRNTLTSLYQFKIATLPNQHQQTEIASPASLILKSASTTGGQETRYPLSTTQKAIIGRSPDCQIQVGLHYTEVSRHHAEFLPPANLDFERISSNWQICDLNSANGTYINDQRLQGGCHTLQPGDRIVLGKLQAAATSPELIFEYQSNTPAAPDEEFDRLLTDCDVLCLVLNPTQPLSADEKRLMDRANKANIFKSIIVVDTSAASHASEIVKTNVSALSAWRQSQVYSQSLHINCLLLKPFYPHNHGNAVETSALQELNQFSEFLEKLANSESEDVVKERVKKQFIAQLATMDSIFNEKIETLNKKTQQQQEALGNKNINELNEQLKIALKQISDDKEKTFQQVKVDLSQSKAALIDPFSRESLLYKVKVFTDELKPVITKESEGVYLRLRSEIMKNSDSIHTYITRLCNIEIVHWAKEEWGQICNSYGNDGLNGFFQRSYTALNFVPDLELSNLSFQPVQQVETSKVLKESVLQFSNTHISLQQISPVGDLIMGGGALAIAAAFGNPIPLIMAGINIFNKNSLQQQAQAAKQEQQTENLKKGICNHYQLLAKSLVEKVSQNLILSLQAEERRVKETIEKAGGQITTHLTEAKKRLDECKAQQNNLNKEKAELLELIKGA